MDTLRLPVLLCALLGSYRVEARGGDGAIVGHHHGNSLLHHQPQDQPQPQRQHQQKQKHQPDGDNPGEDAVAAFLHTGDARTLAHANCSHRFELASSRGSTESMSRVLDTIIHATNFLNMILQNNRSREQSLRSDIEWYQALVRSIIEGDERIHRAVLSFSVDSVKPDVLLQATRSGGHTLLQDLSEDHLHQRSPESEWYHGLKRRKKPLFHKSVLSQDFSVEQRESFIPDRSHVLWSSPYLECERGKLLPRWLLTLSAAFYGKRDQAPEFRGVVRLDINLQDVDIDQCSSHGWFSGTHRCNSTTMECLPIPGYGFVLDKYQCQCKKGFYHPNRVAVNSFTRPGKSGRVSESGPNADEGWSSDCLPCAAGCGFCRDDTPCVPREDGALRLAVVSFQSLCMLLLFISMVLIYHYRRNKSVRASGLVLLEAILCGAVLLYFPVGILYFQPSVFRCILLRWVRLLGFATVYGTLTLKLYR